jgi:hypothetical protein
MKDIMPQPEMQEKNNKTLCATDRLDFALAESRAALKGLRDATK